MVFYSIITIAVYLSACGGGGGGTALLVSDFRGVKKKLKKKNFN